MSSCVYVTCLRLRRMPAFVSRACVCVACLCLCRLPAFVSRACVCVACLRLCRMSVFVSRAYIYVACLCFCGMPAFVSCRRLLLAYICVTFLHLIRVPTVVACPIAAESAGGWGGGPTIYRSTPHYLHFKTSFILQEKIPLHRFSTHIHRVYFMQLFLPYF